MKLAIILGVSDYANATPLPACKNDAYILHEVVASSGRYESILFLSEDTSSSLVKSSISKFILDHAESEVDELFFYFSGHGVFTNQEFHYALSDIDTNKLKQTSLENSELDQLIRSLSPKLTVKVVDACQSGIDYIKSTEGELEKLLQQKTQELKKCYFMLSSNSEQSSYASATISHFTRYFIEAIQKTVSGEVRYKEIMDYISDSFSGNAKQTPLFITQASFTEVFVPVDNTLKKTISNFLNNFVLKPRSGNKTPSISLLEWVKNDAKRYVSKEEAIALLKDIQGKIFSVSTFEDKELEDIFSLVHSKNSSNSSLPRLTQAAEWLEKNQNDFFTKIQWDYKKVTKSVPKNDVRLTAARRLMNIGAGILPEYEVKEVNERFCLDIYNTTELPFSNIITKAQRKLPNANSCELFWLFFVSETKLAILTAGVRSKTTDWGAEFSQRDNAYWSGKVFDITDKVSLNDFVIANFKHFQSYCTEPLKKLMDANKKEEQENLALLEPVKETQKRKT